jgi:hypothetical protein
LNRIGLYFILCISLFYLGACSNSTKADKSTKDGYSVIQAAKDGNVVIQNLSNKFDDIVQGAVKVKNLDKAFAFSNSVTNKKKSSINVVIFNPDGKYYTNKLSYNGTDITFDNKYGGYQLPPGKFQCKFITPRNKIFYLESCKNEKGKSFSDSIAIISEEKSFNNAEQNAK